MTKKQKISELSADVKFFYQHAGYSYDPLNETQEQGRVRCAQDLAAAEGIGRNAGLSFEWIVDPNTDSRDFSNARPAWELWLCSMYDAEGNFVDCLGGVDFGRNGSPHGNDYRRVVEAELAQAHVKQALDSLE